jgi:hypothetical protein
LADNYDKVTCGDGMGHFPFGPSLFRDTGEEPQPELVFERERRSRRIHARTKSLMRAISVRYM